MRLNPIIVAVAGVLALAPSAAPAAAVAVNVEWKDLIIPLPRDQVVYFDVYLTDLDNQDERLNVFTVSLNGVGFSESGIRFLPPELPSPAHPFVFKDFPGAFVENFGSTATRIQAGSVIPVQEGEVNVSETLNGLMRVPVLIPADFRPPTFLFVFTIVPDMGLFGGLGPPITATAGRVGGAPTAIPEPSAAALLSLTAAALLRRPRCRSSRSQ